MKAVLQDETTSDVPFLIIANKTDKYGAVPEDDIQHFFNLHTLTTGKVFRRTRINPRIEATEATND